MEPLSLGFSPCPNDTFVFAAWVHGKIGDAPPVDVLLDDIESLNGLALEERLDVAKVSFHALGSLRDRYCLLHSGGALGRGCGPLVVAREPWSPQELRGKRIAIPGRHTTAALLLRLFDPDLTDLRLLPFHEILEATRDGRVDAGLIIHESRFTFPEYGLHQVVDLGEWWESDTGHPIPLGAIVARRALGAETVQRIDRSLAASVDYAHRHTPEIWDWVRSHAQEMDDDVMRQHIALYVNDFTRDYGPEGEAAIRHLIGTAEGLGIIPTSDASLFID